MAGDRPGATPPRVVLFDLDDTLIDHSDSVRAGVARLRSRYPELRTQGVHDLAALYQQELDRVHPAIVRGSVTEESARRARVRALFEAAGASPPATTLQEAIRTYRNAYRAARRRLPGVLGVVRSLRRRAVLGILSNNRRAEQEAKLAAFGLDSAFDFLLTSEETGWAKPDIRAFRSAVRAAASIPARSVMVGDSWALDVAGARRAGLAAVWVNRWGGVAPVGARVPELTAFTPVEPAVRTILAARPPR